MFLEKFNLEHVWEYYQEVMNESSDDSWTVLSQKNKDIYVHLKFRALSTPPSFEIIKLKKQLTESLEENSKLKMRLEQIEERLV